MYVIGVISLGKYGATDAAPHTKIHVEYCTARTGKPLFQSTPLHEGRLLS